MRGQTGKTNFFGACSGTIGSSLSAYLAEFLGFARLRPLWPLNALQL
jgi:hypothetical protein